jgi:hypothetical protein
MVGPVRKVVNLVTAVLVVLALLAAADLIYFLTHRERYVFGTEVAGWKYESPANFILANVAVIGLALVGLALTLLVSKRSRNVD